MITFFVSGEAKAQPRPRAFARKFGQQYSARVYTPGTAEHWKSLIAEAAKPHIPAQPLPAARVDLFFYFARPKSHYGSGRNGGVLKASAPGRHTQKPDCDNLAKAVLDCLMQIRFFEDAVVDTLLIHKAWSMPREAGVRIAIHPAGVVSSGQLKFEETAHVAG